MVKLNQSFSIFAVLYCGECVKNFSVSFFVREENTFWNEKLALTTAAASASMLVYGDTWKSVPDPFPWVTIDQHWAAYAAAAATTASRCGYTLK